MQTIHAHNNEEEVETIGAGKDDQSDGKNTRGKCKARDLSQEAGYIFKLNSNSQEIEK